MLHSNIFAIPALTLFAIHRKALECVDLHSSIAKRHGVCEYRQVDAIRDRLTIATNDWPPHSIVISRRS